MEDEKEVRLNKEVEETNKDKDRKDRIHFKKQKKLLIVAGGALLLVVIAVLVVLFMIYKNNSNINIDKSIQKTTTDPLPKESYTINNTDISPQTEIVYADTTKLYLLRLDGSQPQEIVEMEEEITSIKFLPDKTNLYVQTYYGSGSASMHSKYNNNWFVNIDTLEKYKSDHDTGLYRHTKSLTTKPEYIYHKYSDTIPEDIISVDLISDSESKIGYLPKPLQRYPNREHYEYPKYYVASFDGELLLVNPNINTGPFLEKAYVLKRDGSKVYDLEADKPDYDGIWLDNNILLLSKGQDSKIFTFSNDDFEEKTIEFQTNNPWNIEQSLLSPNRKYLAHEERLGDYYNEHDDISYIYELPDFKSIIQIDGYPLGWDKESKYLLTFGDSSKLIKIQDFQNEKEIVIAKINKIPEGSSATYFFDIR